MEKTWLMLGNGSIRRIWVLIVEKIYHNPFKKHIIFFRIYVPHKGWRKIAVALGFACARRNGPQRF